MTNFLLLQEDSIIHVVVVVVVIVIAASYPFDSAIGCLAPESKLTS